MELLKRPVAVMFALFLGVSLVACQGMMGRDSSGSSGTGASSSGSGSSKSGSGTSGSQTNRSGGTSGSSGSRY